MLYWRIRRGMQGGALAAGLVVVIGILLMFQFSSHAAEPEVKARSALLMSADNGQVLYEKNADVRVAPASITKIMTMLLAMDAIEAGEVSLDDMVATSTAASQIGGSQIWLMEGEKMRLSDMMRAVAIVSANDAAYAVAEFIAGSADGFVGRMNERSKELGMEDTHFENPDGLPSPEHYTTTRDIAKMSRELIAKHPSVLEWTSVWTDWLTRTDPRVRQKQSFLRNTNELITRYPGADGLKTGMTEEAGYCLSATARRDDTRLISVVMGLATNDDRLDDTTKLLNFGFREFDRAPVAKKDDVVGKIRVPNGRREMVPVAVSMDFAVLVQKGKKDLVRTRLVSGERRAPIRRGDPLGQIVAVADEREIMRADVIAAEDVPRASFLAVLSRAIRDFFGGLFGRTRPQTELASRYNEAGIS